MCATISRSKSLSADGFELLLYDFESSCLVNSKYSTFFVLFNVNRTCLSDNRYFDVKQGCAKAIGYRTDIHSVLVENV